MAIPTKGARRKPSYSQALAIGNLTLAVQREGTKQGCTLVVDLAQPHPSNWLSEPGGSVVPAEVANDIRMARQAGWNPEQPGRPFLQLRQVH